MNNQELHRGAKKWKFFVVVILLFLGLSTATFAQIPYEQREAPPMEQQPQEQKQLVISYEDEIKENELPEAIRDSKKETYPDYKVSEIYRGSDGSYKLKLEKGDEKIAIFYSAEGEFIRLEEDKNEDSINDDWR